MKLNLKLSYYKGKQKTFSKWCNKESTFKITVSQGAFKDVQNYQQREEKKLVVFISDQGSLVKNQVLMASVKTYID